MTRAAEADIAVEFEGAGFQDERLNRRLASLGATLAREPDRSFPRVLPAAELEAAYRFFGNTKVTPGTIVAPHVRQTLGRIADQSVCLIAHDSSTISFNSEGGREGLTPTQGTKQSFMTHCSLAVRADGSRRAEGILAASYHIPTDATKGVLQERWTEHVLGIHALGVAAAQVIHVMDREADDYDIFSELLTIEGRFVIRARHNRSTEEGKLRSVLDRASIQAERELALSRRTGKGFGPKQRKIHPPRESRQAIAASRLTIRRPENSRASREMLALNAVRVWEPSPPAGEEAVEWLLYTTEPIDTPEQVLQVVDWYRARWTIEEFFKALKTGCALEKRQLGDFHALANATALSLPIAWKLMLLKSESRVHPQEPAETVLDSDELAVLRVKAEKPLPRKPTVSDVVCAIARLGGHLKHNGPPGWQTLARGYERLRAWVEGWRLRELIEHGRANEASKPSTA